jgi:hypothetical protein
MSSNFLEIFLEIFFNENFTNGIDGSFYPYSEKLMGGIPEGREEIRKGRDMGTD